jgi:TolB-like protein/lipoprotein NlpI
MALHRIFRFGDFTLDEAEHRLKQGEREIPLRPRSFETLLYLLGKHGHLVEKNEFIEKLWSGAFVTETVLTHCITEIRQALDDEAHDPRYIQTVHRAGYTFIADVEEITMQPHTIEIAAKSRKLAIDSIAVLPFANLNADPNQDYFVDGMTDLLITDLGKIRTLRVISRTSVLRYKAPLKPLPEIGRELNVDAILEGSVLVVAEQVRINVQLIETSTDRHLWAESYERDLRDIFSLQNEVARAIAREIRVTLTPAEEARLSSARPVNPAVYLEYLKGRYSWNRRTLEGLNDGLKHFQQAIEVDPLYAPAHAAIADCHCQRFAFFLPRNEVLQSGKRAAIRALEIDPELADAHTSLGLIKSIEFDWPGAAKECRQAIALNPSYASAHHWIGTNYFMLTKNFDEALAEIKQARLLDPFSLIIDSDVGLVMFMARRYKEALEHCQKLIEREPDFCRAHLYSGWAYAQLGKLSAAVTELELARQLDPNPFVLAWLGYTYAISGRKTDSEKVLDEFTRLPLKGDADSFFVAIVHTGLGHSDLAFEWFEKACKGHAFGLPMLGMHAAFDVLRPDPRYQDMIRRMGLTF